MPIINADEIAGQIDRNAVDWTPDTLRGVFVTHGCAVVRDVIPLEHLTSLHDLITQAYRNETGPHVYDTHLLEITGGRTSGFELVDVPLLQGLLKEAYAGQDWRRDSFTARRIQGVDADHD